MQEDFLHYLWKFKKFDFTKAFTTAGERVVLIDPGIHNHNSGPDFFNAKLKIGDQLWAGNVEIHLRASDWYFHRHESDKNYDNVILHVVWEDDIEVYRKNNSVIPSLALHNITNRELINTYRELLGAGGKWINCETDFAGFDDFKMEHWLERIYFERLERKSSLIRDLLQNSGNNWEAVLFQMMAKNFGLNVNGESFLSLAQSFEFSVLQKCAADPFQLEALFFGQLGMLTGKPAGDYHQKLKSEYNYLKHKFKLDQTSVIPAKFFRLRPDNFPSIRLSQLASLYSHNPNLFSNLIKAENPEIIYEILSVEPSLFWQTHYSFKKEHSKKSKSLSKTFADLLIINTIVPVKFSYSRAMGKDPENEILEMLQQVKAEKNSMVEKFNHLRINTAKNALQSQALIELKNNYCNKNRCLQCALGVHLLQS